MEGADGGGSVAMREEVGGEVREAVGDGLGGEVDEVEDWKLRSERSE